MLQTMLVTGVTPLHNKDEINHWENRPFSVICAEMSNRKTDITKNRTIKKKYKRVRTAFTTDQLRALEKTFQLTKYINPENRHELSKQLNIGEKCIKIWFQNRRMKEKRESSAESSDSSSETLGTEIMSPSLVVQPESTPIQYDQHNQYETPMYQEPYAFYQLPVQQHLNVDKVHTPPDNAFIPINDYNNGMFFYNEINPCTTQYSPSGEVDVNNAYVHQDQYQYTSEMFNWCANNMDSYNFYQ